LTTGFSSESSSKVFFFYAAVFEAYVFYVGLKSSSESSESRRFDLAGALAF